MRPLQRKRVLSVRFIGVGGNINVPIAAMLGKDAMIEFDEVKVMHPPIAAPVRSCLQTFLQNCRERAIG